MITKVKVIIVIELLGFMLIWGGGMWSLGGLAMMLLAFFLLLKRYLKIWKKGRYSFYSEGGRVDNYWDEMREKGWKKYWPF